MNAYENNMYRQSRKNIIRTWIIITLFFLVVSGVAYVFAEYYGNVSIILAAMVGALISNITSYYFSERIAIASSGAKQADPHNPRDRRLIRVVENMSITAGVPTPKVYVIDDPAPNAFATGRNPEHASVAFTSGILEILSDAELEGVAAHEISHIKNRDILVGTIVVVMIGFVALLADIITRIGISGGSRRSSGEGGPAAGVIILVAVAFAVLSPLIGALIQAAVSRKREYLADSSGILLTRYPEGLAHALRKISTHAQPMQKSSQATSHLFIANPFGENGSLKQTVSNLFSTHPPMERRVEALLGSREAQDLLGRKAKTDTQ